ncbi:YIF1-domain-containing protein [Ceraceosorus guamensis]|uniref:YIF1-domain-containing protein n=1 Tax=Ceraceosorus guamensis TaxID=1522189 RepID=A0A316VZK0_9BASI|nr:YIF1-domain-containing protein [Ceraceosorus guamensis]PWN40915.1 YIF1-domain-containing protein [Ceraceosorus guamensis]
MYQQGQYSSRSPPPLQHPVPTHPPVQVPIPSGTPGPGSQSSGRPSIDGGGFGSTSTAEAHLSSARARGGQSESGYARYASPPLQNPYGQPQNQYQQHAGGMGAGSKGVTGGMMHQQQQPQQQHPNQGFQQFGSFASFANGMGNGQAGMGGNMLNDATAQMGVQFGRQMAAAGQEYVGKNFGSFLPVPLLKHYFNVSNSYVLHKLRLVLFPWRHKPWSRLHAAAAGASAYGGEPQYGASTSKAEGYAPPREDVNSPDLYIPVMAFVTYVLLVCIIRGIESRFHPEVLGLTSSKALGIVFFEFAAVKLGCYLLNIQGDHTVIDLVAYGGYKFVGAIVTLLAGLTLPGRLIYWSVFAYTCAANAFFLLRSLRYVVLPDPSSPSSVTITPQTRSRRIQFLFAIAAVQTLYCFLLIIGIWH